MQFAVIGLGVFGRTCALELQANGNEVLGIDLDEGEVDKVSNLLSHAVIADATDKQVIDELNLAQYDGVLVSIGEDLEASLLCTLNLIEMNVKNLWVKAKTDAHHAILASLGVTNIIHPEQDMGVRIAQMMNYPTMKQYLALSNDQLLVRIDIPKGWAPRSVAAVHTHHPHTRLVLVTRGEKVINNIREDTILQYPDNLIYVGRVEDLTQLATSFTDED